MFHFLMTSVYNIQWFKTLTWTIDTVVIYSILPLHEPLWTGVVQLCILSLDARCTTLAAEVKIPRQFPSFRITAAGVMEFFI